MASPSKSNHSWEKTLGHSWRIYNTSQLLYGQLFLCLLHTNKLYGFSLESLVSSSKLVEHLNMNYNVFPSALILRFSITLGTNIIAQKVVSNILTLPPTRSCQVSWFLPQEGRIEYLDPFANKLVSNISNPSTAMYRQSQESHPRLKPCIRNLQHISKGLQYPLQWQSSKQFSAPLKAPRN